jgi:hypothetical protein
MNKLCGVCEEREAVRPKRAPVECSRCYQRRYYRENLAHARIPAADRRDPITYANAHWRVQKVRGKAAEHACARCAVPAQEWSYTEGDTWEQTGVVIERRHVRGELVERSYFTRWSPNPYAYEALCIPCHLRKDGRAS